MPIPFLIGLGIAAVGAFVGSAAIAAAREIYIDSLSTNSLNEEVRENLFEFKEEIGNKITLCIKEKNYSEIHVDLYNDHFEHSMQISASEISDELYVGYKTVLTLD